MILPAKDGRIVTEIKWLFPDRSVIISMKCPQKRNKSGTDAAKDRKRTDVTLKLRGKTAKYAGANLRLVVFLRDSAILEAGRKVVRTMSFGERLQAVRRKHDMTQEEFAAQLKVSRQAVSKWESSRGYPEIEKIIYICNRYGVTMDALFADEVPTGRKETDIPAETQVFRGRPLKRELSDFFTNLSFANKCMIGGLLAAAVLLVLLISHHLKGGTDRVMTIVWTGAIILFGVVEAVTAGLVSIWFVAGALVALVAAFVGASLPVQIVLFLVVSAAALAVTQPMLSKMTSIHAMPTNADRVLGNTAKVTETIDNENSAGAVYVDGKTWTARSVDGTVIPAGSRVTIESMEGVKLLVRYSENKVEVE